ncbi:hypothetical protein N7520_009381 [Penicillium odoratum]|uniref:uncharacterized protein n=1 Tax=Penicillium odoratum TaxID=1167516 RepID=UPI002549685E|nr:uncharacterized protein N7520_009381 [Penicillium odoratum]KAJ5752464.1 hypothetical protein N7520_009381 [Penicillium odoratum]
MICEVLGCQLEAATSKIHTRPTYAYESPHFSHYFAPLEAEGDLAGLIGDVAHDEMPQERTPW